MPWKETDLAYLAGLIDGEGTVTIYRHGKRDRLILCIYNSHEGVLLWVHATFGGRFRKVRRRRVDLKQAYVWDTGWQHAAGILEACLPYLKIKRVQAELFLAHAATSKRYGSPGVPADVAAKRFGLVTEIRRLNRKGSDDALAA